MDYDHFVLGVGNGSHPANEPYCPAEHDEPRGAFGQEHRVRVTLELYLMAESAQELFENALSIEDVVNERFEGVLCNIVKANLADVDGEPEVDLSDVEP